MITNIYHLLRVEAMIAHCALALPLCHYAYPPSKQLLGAVSPEATLYTDHHMLVHLPQAFCPSIQTTTVYCHLPQAFCLLQTHTRCTLYFQSTFVGYSYI